MKIRLCAILVFLALSLTGCIECRGEGCDGCPEGFEKGCTIMKDIETGERIEWCFCKLEE